MPQERRRSPHDPAPPGRPPARHRTPEGSSGSVLSSQSHAARRAPPTSVPPETMAMYDRRPRPQLSEDDNNRFGPALPPIQSAMFEYSHTRGGRGLPPVQLPPMRASPPLQQPPPTRDANHTMSVTSLLSRNPDSPKRAQRRPGPPDVVASQPQLQPAIYQNPRSSPSVYGSSPSEGRSMLPNRAPAPLHYMDQPPGSDRAPPPPPNFPSHQFNFSHPRYPSTASEPDVPHHSPATSLPYSPGYYPQSSQPSPTTAFAPAYTEPPQSQLSQPPPLDYNLVIRQQPVAARACGFGERDRRVIDPPPILELRTTDKKTGAPEIDHSGMLALHCTLLNRDGSEDETEVVHPHPDGPAARRLMGSLVAAPYQAKDENGIAGTFFVFPDLSCRNPGKYRLKFTLIRIDPTCMTPGTKHPTVAHIITDLFSVFTAKDFPGMRASSGLLKALRRQGLNVGVKKGSEARKGKGKAKKLGGNGGGSSDEDEDDEDGSDGEGADGGRRKESLGSGGTGGDDEEGISPKSKRSSTGGGKGKKRRRESQ